jgi:glutathione S-transferase
LYLEELTAMMVLYSGTTCPYSHRCRFVLFEKGMDFEIRDVDVFAKPEDIALMNPYNEVPILVERPHPVRVAHHQRVHRRALPAPAADAR